MVTKKKVLRDNKVDPNQIVCKINQGTNPSNSNARNLGKVKVQNQQKYNVMEGTH